MMTESNSMQYQELFNELDLVNSSVKDWVKTVASEIGNDEENYQFIEERLLASWREQKKAKSQLREYGLQANYLEKLMESDTVSIALDDVQNLEKQYKERKATVRLAKDDYKKMQSNLREKLAAYSEAFQSNSKQLESIGSQLKEMKELEQLLFQLREEEEGLRKQMSLEEANQLIEIETKRLEDLTSKRKECEQQIIGREAHISSLSSKLSHITESYQIAEKEYREKELMKRTKNIELEGKFEWLKAIVNIYSTFAGFEVMLNAEDHQICIIYEKQYKLVIILTSQHQLVSAKMEGIAMPLDDLVLLAKKQDSCVQYLIQETHLRLACFLERNREIDHLRARGYSIHIQENMREVLFTTRTKDQFAFMLDPAYPNVCEALTLVHVKYDLGRLLTLDQCKIHLAESSATTLTDALIVLENL